MNVTLTSSPSAGQFWGSAVRLAININRVKRIRGFPETRVVKDVDLPSFIFTIYFW